MAGHYQNNDEHQRYQKRLSKVEKPDNPSINKVSERENLLKKGVPAVTKSQKIGNTKRALSILVPFILIFLISFYVVSPLSKVSRVVVSGNHNLSAKDVENASSIKNGRYIWGFWNNDQKLLKQAQRNNPQIKKLRVSITGPRSVNVKIAEYPVIGVINHDDRQELLLSNGKYRPVSGKINNYLQYSNFSGSNIHLDIVAREIGKLPEPVRQSISEAIFSPTRLDPDRIKLIMNDGNTVLIKADSIGDKMKYYPSIVSHMNGNGIIDLQYGAYSYNYGDKNK